MQAQLTKPDVDTWRIEGFNLLLSGDLVRGIQRTGTENTFSTKELKKTAPPDFESDLKYDLNYKYLLVNRVVEYKKPQVVSTTSFVPGGVRLEAFLFDLSSGKILCAIPYQALSSDKISYSYKEGSGNQTQIERAQSFAESSIFSNARKELQRQLENVVNAKVDLD